MKQWLFLILNLSVYALPQNPLLVSGEASLKLQSPQLLEITAADQTVIDWDRFSIDAQETARFIQPNSDSIVLNRVLLSEPSRIMGRLEGNGQVILLNPNGILVGKEARIDLGSFVASTLDVNTQAFTLRKELCFQGSSQEILQNLGSIQAAGDVFLIGPNIDNQGSINAALVSALAANEVWIMPAESEKILLKDSSMTHLTFNGSISSPSVILMGDFLESWDLNIDASGKWGGGTVLIGGGERGQDSRFINASSVYVGPNVDIHAECTEKGHGGKAVIWADGQTRFFGSITASGGPLGGNGGFAEISGKNMLEYDGFVDLAAFGGEKGTLLFDPIDITVTTAAGGALNAAAPGCTACALAPFTCQTNPATQPFLINNTTLVGILNAGTNVVLDATVAGAGGGTITVNPGANIGNRVGPLVSDCPGTGPCWTGTGNLALNATNGITIRAHIQNSGGIGAAGSIYLSSVNGPILINTVGNSQAVSVGSQNGTTQICAPNADVTLQPASNVSGRHAQIGFYIPETVGGTAAGPIDINCRDLNVLGPNNVANASSQIGHGQFNFTILTPFSTADTSTITIAARNINIENAPGAGAHQRTSARIGHGMQNLASGSDMRGNLTVIATGNITLTSRNAPGGPGTDSLLQAQIGHGGSVEGGGAGGYSVNADYFVQAGGDILMELAGTVPYFSSSVGIGSGGNELATVNSNLTVIAGGSITMNGYPNNIVNMQSNSNTVVIGWFSTGAVVPIITGNINVSACNNITMHVNGSSNTTSPAIFGIGYVPGLGAAAVVTGDVNVACGGDLLFDALLTQPLLGAGFIGNEATVASLSNTAVAVGGNLTIFGAGSQNIGVRAPGNVSVAAGGNITLTAPALGGTAYIGPHFGANAVTTRLYAGGNIIATNSPTGRAIIGQSFNTSAAFNTSLDIRAGGDVQLASSFTLNGVLVAQPTTGNIYIAADETLAAGALWNAGGGQITSIASTPLAAPLPTLNCGLSPIQGNSAAVASDMFGALEFVTGGLAPTPITLSTTAASPLGITLHSAEMNAAAALFRNLTIGVDVILSNPNGNYDISGSIPEDGFNNININAALTTSGSIFVRANAILTQNAAVTSSGIQPVSLISGNRPFPGGDLILTQNVSSAGGNVLVQAGTGMGCTLAGNTSSIVQNGGAISTLGIGNITANADGNISLTGAASVTLDGGSFHSLAGSNTFLVNAIITKTGAGTTGATDFLMISGGNIDMTNSHIAAPLSFVTLVVDNCFPFPPLIGPGAFNLDGASTIDPINLRIYTARQNLNTILGLLNGAVFIPGSLFVDTSTESWCLYFEQPFPYPFSNLGVPFTIFYKPCLEELANQALIITSQFLLDLHPMNEFPGWEEQYWFRYVKLAGIDEPYFIRRRNLSILNNPKTWTVWMTP